MQRNLVSEASPEDDSNLILSSDLDSSFDQLLSSFKSARQGREITETFNGDLLLDHYYTISSTKLNSLLFNPRTRFWHALSRIQGTVGFQAEDWTSESNGEVLKRSVTYQKAAQPPLLFKPVNVEEEQTYAGIENETFTILCSVRTPDVLLGNSFKTELLYSISPGPDLAEEQKTSHLVITWRIKFSKGTIFESMVRDSARKGLKSSFGQFSELLGRNAELIELKDLGAKLQMLASVEPDFESSWRMAMKSFANPTFIFSVLGIGYILVHVAKANARVIQGLEFPLFDLPDSFGELVFPVVLTLLGERALGMVSRFLAARRHQASDHGVRAHGKGWMLTVALLEGSNLDAVDSTESDPYVVFTCNGQSKISSIKFLTLKPQWNEIFSFDAMDGAPALMEVDLYGSSGLHKETALLGHTEVNFLSSKLSDLGDMWVSLTRNVVLAGESHLHLRIFIENNKGTDIVREYHEKLEREVGRKVSINSAQKNAAFQMHFGLPQEEFLIKDFKCELRKEGTIKFGRLHLSPRTICFRTDIFYQDCTFFFIWEDIESIREVPPSTIRSSSLLIILRKGKGLVSNHEATSFDEEGRQSFLFQTFTSFEAASRIIMTIWKSRDPKQKVGLVEEEAGSPLCIGGIDESLMSEVFSSSLPLNISFVMELYNGGEFEQRVMKKVGCTEYTVTAWEPVKVDVYQRQVNFKLGKHLPWYNGKIQSTQHKSIVQGRNGWIIEQILTIPHAVLGSHFNVCLRYQIEHETPDACHVSACVGIKWLKITRSSQVIARSTLFILTSRIKKMFSLIEKEFK